jgi:glycosyltransferase involved in cell wall biosynthesis
VSLVLQTKVVVVLPPNRRPAEIVFYLANSEVFRVEAVCDAASAGTVSAAGAKPIVAEFQRARVFGRQAGPSAVLHCPRLSDVLKDVDILVSVEMFSSLTHDSATVARERGIPHVCVVWETLPHNPVFWLPPYRTYFQAAKRSVSGVIAATQRAKDAHISAGLRPDRLVQIYPGCPALYARGPDLTKGSGLRILFMGNLFPWKGIRTLIEAFKRVKRNRPDCQLTIAGTGPLGEMLEEQQRRLTGLRYEGWVSEERKLQLLREADAFVYPSTVHSTLGIKRWEEQFGHSVVEAMSMGLPPVVTRSGALPEVVGDAGLIVSEGDADELASAILEVRSPRVFPALQHRSLERARRLFDPSVQREKFERFLQQASGC